MANPKYPRKLRQKLEKIAAEREARARIPQGDDNENPLAMPDEFKTLWHHFLSPGQVGMMHGLADQPNRKLIIVMDLFEPRHHPAVGIMAPWLLSEPPSS